MRVAFQLPLIDEAEALAAPEAGLGPPAMAAISSEHFYEEYHGHRTTHLATLHSAVRKDRAVLWLLGDSTLDNKHWIRGHRGPEPEPACNGYEDVLRPPRSTPDVAFHINRELVSRALGDRACCINTSVEEGTLGARRSPQELFEQDAFCRDHLQAEDVLVVSCGGNDIALRPTVMTVFAMLALLCCPACLIRCASRSRVFRHLVPGLGHFLRLFGTEAKRFVERVCEHRRPTCVVLCMLYYLDELAGDSWADCTLRILGYNRNPAKLQLIMRIVFEMAISKVAIEGTTVVPVPLYEALDGKDTNDYVARVEPSSQGGAKMAKLIVDRLLEAMGPTGWPAGP